MTWRSTTASMIAVFALAACSSTADESSGAPYDNGQTSAATGEPGGDGDGDGDPSEDDEDDGPLGDLPGSPTNACDPWTQDCPADEKCSWEQVNGVAQTRCVGVEPEAKLPGEPCTVFGDPNSGYDDCVLGAVCTDVDALNMGVCAALCGGSLAEPVCEQEFAKCHLCPDCPSLCVPLCDPLAQDCAPGFACTPDSGSFACHPSEELGQGALGDTCEYTFQCAAGHACVDAAKVPDCAGAGCCSAFCSVSDPSCPNPMVCVPWFDTDAPPLPDLGVCQAL